MSTAAVYKQGWLVYFRQNYSCKYIHRFHTHISLKKRTNNCKHLRVIPQCLCSATATATVHQINVKSFIVPYRAQLYHTGLPHILCIESS